MSIAVNLELALAASLLPSFGAPEVGHTAQFLADI
jgi:hypothetical protein